MGWEEKAAKAKAAKAKAEADAAAAAKAAADVAAKAAAEEAAAQRASATARKRAGAYTHSHRIGFESATGFDSFLDTFSGEQKPHVRHTVRAVTAIRRELRPLPKVHYAYQAGSNR